MKARREVKVALNKKDKALERKARNKVHKLQKKVRRTIIEQSKNGWRYDDGKTRNEKKVLYHHN